MNDKNLSLTSASKRILLPITHIVWVKIFVFYCNYDNPRSLLDN